MTYVEQKSIDDHSKYADTVSCLTLASWQPIVSMKSISPGDQTITLQAYNHVYIGHDLEHIHTRHPINYAHSLCSFLPLVCMVKYSSRLCNEIYIDTHPGADLILKKERDLFTKYSHNFRWTHPFLMNIEPHPFKYLADQLC